MEIKRLSNSSIGGASSENEDDDEKDVSNMVEEASVTGVDSVVDLVNEGVASELVVACRHCVSRDIAESTSVGELPASTG